MPQELAMSHYEPVPRDEDDDGEILAPLFPGRRRPAESEEERARTARAAVRAAAGDRNALRYLYVLYSGSVYGFVRRIVGDEHEAEDITQQVFLKLMTAHARYEPTQASFSAWLLRVARNLTIDHLRQRQAIVTEHVFGPDARADDSLAAQSLCEALASLPEAQRRVVVLRQVLGLSPREVADRLGKTEGSVHVLYHRGRAAARKSLEQLNAVPCTRPGLSGSRPRRDARVTPVAG